ncbi:MAG: hypothetical protein ABR591_14615, partial [Candidatus Velthaea sp.]
MSRSRRRYQRDGLTSISERGLTMLKQMLLAGAFALGVTGYASAQTPTQLTGKVVDLATYVTKDHNMDAMHGTAMHGDAMKGESPKPGAPQGDAMHGDAMHGDAMHGESANACPEILGI